MYWWRLAGDFSLWMLGIALHIVLRIFIICCLPVLFLASGFMLNKSRQSEQTSFDLAMLFHLRIAPAPRVDWSRLPFLRGRRSATNHTIVAGEVLPPLDEEPTDLRRIGKP